MERLKEREAARERGTGIGAGGAKSADGKDDSPDGEGLNEERVNLSAGHFAKALRKVRPSVSPVEDTGLQDFKKRFYSGSS